MNPYKLDLLALICGSLFIVESAFATNPIIMDQFTADPTARVFEGQVCLYPSHDIPVPPGSSALSAKGGSIQIRVDSENGPLLATVKITKGSDWAVVKSKASRVPDGIHDLFVSQAGSGPVDLDWISFQ